MDVDRVKDRAEPISAEIRAYYVDNARVLPWRIPPQLSARGTRPDPYHVWLSEVMLQQTTVAAVKAYFKAFTRRWPTVFDLAAAEEEAVLAAWAGLGYYARARNLHKCARYIVEKYQGTFPDNEADLLQLPGVGAYTAAAIAAIAFGERAIVVDANIERLVARLFGIDTPLPAGKSDIRRGMDALMPQSGAGDFAQACMDIGATLCTARNPRCTDCPVQSHCLAFAQGNAESLPVKPPKKKKPVRAGRFFWIEREDQLLLIKRPARGMLGSMRGLPDDGWAARTDGHGRAPLDGDWQLHANIVQHSFTHFSLEVDLAVYQWDKMAINSGDSITENFADAVWWPLRGIEDAGLPTLFAKAVQWKMKEQK